MQICGLSLCIQGTHRTENTVNRARRFIPVYTGNTLPNIFSKFLNSVYPCAYREHPPPAYIRKFRNGLSLCIQGTHLNQCFYRMLLRFIPVHTGNTNTFKCFFCNYPVYPCAYREHKRCDVLGIGDRRFIPVHTGNTPIITYCFIIKILTTKFLPIFLDIFH